MDLTNLFKLVTKSGHSSLDAVKSAIQKYARRGMRVEMLQAVSEMDSFSSYVDSEDVMVHRASKAIRTNMINRLKVILFEDVSFSQVGIFTTVIEKIKEWEESERTDKEVLSEIVALIASAKKLRQPIYLRAMYGEGEACSIDKKDFLDGVDNETLSCMEWIYHNDEEALKMLSDRQFPGKDIVLPLVTAEWKRLKPTKNRKGSNERFIFVAIPWLWIMYDSHLSEIAGLDSATNFTSKEITSAYKKVDIKFDPYVYDIHTKEGKKQGKTVEDFRIEGAVVVNEDDVWLDEDLKDFYTNQPDDKLIAKKRKTRKSGTSDKPQKPKRLRRGAIKTDGIRDIDVDVNDIDLILEGVCGCKLPCGFLSIKGKDKVVKPMTKGLNYGMDYIYVDKQKRLFGLRNLDIKIRKIPGKKLIVKRSETEDDKGKTIKQKSYEWEDNEEGQVITIMTRVNATKDLGKRKDLLKDEDKYRDMLKIMLFNGLFRTSDNILRNILVDEDDEMWAIDENDIFGKRKNVFNKREHIKNSAFLTADLVTSVIDELDFATHEETLVEDLSKYFPKASCDLYEKELRERVLGYKQKVLDELNLNS